MTHKERIETLEQRMDAVERKLYPQQQKHHFGGRTPVRNTPAPDILPELTDAEKQWLEARKLPQDRKNLHTISMQMNSTPAHERELIRQLQSKRSFIIQWF